jgi:hydrogenase/urease accessory protein HupE
MAMSAFIPGMWRSTLFMLLLFLAGKLLAHDLPPLATSEDIAQYYLRLGMEHIIGGLDHLLFVFALLVIARTPRRVLWTVTGFTLGHSLTLSLAALGYVSLPVPPMEAAIALSIVFLAVEIARGDRQGLTYRYPLLVSCGFGLLHGLGFASALGEIGLVEDAMLWSLLFFNLGVEAGQLLFIAVLALLVPLFVRAGRTLQETAGQSFALQALAARVDLVAAYCIGIPASWWLVERLAQFA